MDGQPNHRVGAALVNPLQNGLCKSTFKVTVMYLNGMKHVEEWTLVRNRHFEYVELHERDRIYSEVCHNETGLHFAAHIGNGVKELIKITVYDLPFYIGGGEIRTVGPYELVHCEDFFSGNLKAFIRIEKQEIVTEVIAH